MVAIAMIAVAIISGISGNTLSLPKSNDKAAVTTTVDTDTADADAAAAAKSTTTTTATGGTEAKASSWIVWYCLMPESKVDDFGPNPYPVRPTPEQNWKTFKNQCYSNTLVGMSAVYFVDCITGNRYLVTYYQAYENDTDALNAAIKYYSTGSNKYDSAEYTQLMDDFFSWLESHDLKISVMTGRELKEQRGVVVHDQLYANLYSAVYDQDGFEVPAAIVYDCGYGGDEDLYLVVDFTIKNRVVTAIWHDNCGHQPCNPSEVMRVEVKPNPAAPAAAPAAASTASNTTKKTTTSTTTSSSGGSSSKKDDPKKDDTTKKYSKTKQGAYSAKSNDSGTTPDTGTGVGSTQSAAEKTTNSGENGKTLEQEAQDIKQKEEINKSDQKTGQDASTPSTTVAPRQGTDKVIIDNRGDTGGSGGNGNINKPTTTTTTPETYNGGKELENTDETNANKPWGDE